MSLKVLLVDDDPGVCSGLCRLLGMVRPDWELRCAFDGVEALELLKAFQADVVLTDVRMPRMSGDRLLEQVKRDRPSTIRILLSGHSNSSMSLRSIGAAHRFLSKPCETETIVEAVEASTRLRTLEARPEIAEIVAGAGGLPAAPSLYFDLVHELDCPEPDLQRAADIISSDVAMSAKVLQLVNSSFYGIGRRVVSTKDAASILGTAALRNVVAFADAFARFRTSNLDSAWLEGLQAHSLAVGAVTQLLAMRHPLPSCTNEDAQLAGMLHDIGKLLLAGAKPKERRAIVQEHNRYGLPEQVLEERLWGVGHAEIGAYLLRLWGLPDTIAEALAFHHSPEAATSDIPSLATFVGVADTFVHAAGAPTPLTAALFARWGLTVKDAPAYAA